MTALTDPLAEGAVQAVLEAGDPVTPPAPGRASGGPPRAGPQRTANKF